MSVVNETRGKEYSRVGTDKRKNMKVVILEIVVGAEYVKMTR